MWLASLSDQQRESLLGLAHNVVVSDGVLDPNEEKMMAAFRREMSVPENLQIEYLELDGIEVVFDSHRSRVVALLNLLRLSYSDGAFEIEEECTLKEISQAFEIDDQEFLLIDNWVRRLVALEEEAQGLMR